MSCFPRRMDAPGDGLNWPEPEDDNAEAAQQEIAVSRAASLAPPPPPTPPGDVFRCIIKTLF
eukprot:SAG22_NODE_1363_length_4612_cov_2.100377_2_plen_62_part_00